VTRCDWTFDIFYTAFDQEAYGFHTAAYPISNVKCYHETSSFISVSCQTGDRGMKLTAQFHLVPGVRMLGPLS